MGIWLDTVFYEFDYSILAAIHQFALATGSFMTYIMRAITMLADHGYGMIALGLLLLPFKRTRKLGLAALFAIGVGALITNVTLKPLVERARPYEHPEFAAMWNELWALKESEHSFPSGHTTSAMAAMMGIFLAAKNKKRWWPVLIFPFLMGFTRLYFVVHYPTDVIGGLITGALGGLGGFALIWLLYHFVIEPHKDHRIVSFYLRFDPVVSAVRFVISKLKRPQALAAECDTLATEATEEPVQKNDATNE